MANPNVIILGEYDSEWQPIEQRVLQGGYQLTRVTKESEAAEQISYSDSHCVVMISSQGALWDPVAAAHRLRSICAEISLILLAKDSSEKLAIRALKAGINDYFCLPFDVEDISATILHYAGTSRLPSKTYRTPKTPNSDQTIRSPDTIVGDSVAINSVRQAALKYAKTSSNVLITGETGTGKELVAQLIHGNSCRRDTPAVCVNCAAIPESLLESELFGYERGAFTGAAQNRDGLLMHANKSTLFLDEIGEMSACAQAKILRAIETKNVSRVGGKQLTPIDIRLIAATNQDLEELVETKRFRKDLFFRLNVARIRIPPLRERPQDIKLLCCHFMAEFNKKFNRDIAILSENLLSLFIQYDWPGNVRELKNVLEAIYINQPLNEIHARHLPEHYSEVLSNRPDTAAGDLGNEERDKVLVALTSTNWNKSRAAQELNWSRMTLYRKMQKYHITEPHGAYESSPDHKNKKITANAENEHTMSSRGDFSTKIVTV